MPTVFPAPFVPFWGHDDHGFPLAGGQLFSFKAGTDTALETYHDPQGRVKNANPVILDDAGYARVYLISGQHYKLRLTDEDDVLLWEVDHVGGPGGMVLPPVPMPGPAEGGAIVFPAAIPAGYRVRGVTCRITQPFGTSYGLEAIAIGGMGVEDGWGVLEAPFSKGDQTTQRDMLRGDEPIATSDAAVTLTAMGGTFDGLGSAELLVYVEGLETPTPDLVVLPPVPLPSPPGPVGGHILFPGALPAGYRVRGVTFAITEAFGSTQGLTGIYVGGMGLEDGWGLMVALGVGYHTEQHNFRRGDKPITTSDEPVVLTARGGSFDGTGAGTLTVYVEVL